MSRKSKWWPKIGGTYTQRCEGVESQVLVVDIQQLADAPATIFGWEFPNRRREPGANPRWVECEVDRDNEVLRKYPEVTS